MDDQQRLSYWNRSRNRGRSRRSSRYVGQLQAQTRRAGLRLVHLDECLHVWRNNWPERRSRSQLHWSVGQRLSFFIGMDLSALELGDRSEGEVLVDLAGLAELEMVQNNGRAHAARPDMSSVANGAMDDTFHVARMNLERQGEDM